MARYITVGYMVTGLLLWVILSRGFATLWDWLRWNDTYILGENLKLTQIVAFGFAFLSVAFLWRHHKVNEWLKDCLGELRKVTWPTKKETYAATIVVIITSFIVAIILGVFDLIFGKLTALIYG